MGMTMIGYIIQQLARDNTKKYHLTMVQMMSSSRISTNKQEVVSRQFSWMTMPTIKIAMYTDNCVFAIGTTYHWQNCNSAMP